MKDQKFIEIIQDLKTVLIISSRPLDFDCISSGLILKKYLESLGKKVTLMFPSKIKKEDRKFYSFLPFLNEIKDEDTRGVLKKKNFDLLILLDGMNGAQFYDSSKNTDNPPDLNIYPTRVHIDHHVSDPEHLGTHTLQDSSYSSTMEVILDKIIPDEFIDGNIATLAYNAISSDTGNFQWNFHPSTLKKAAFLLEKGADPFTIIDKIFFSKSKTYLQMLGLATLNIEYLDDLKTIFLFLSYKKIQDLKLTDHQLEELKSSFSYDIARSVAGYARGIMLYEPKKGKVQLSARGSNTQNKINLPDLFASIGAIGGGHFNACGADIQGNFEEVKQKLIGTIKQSV